MINEAQVKKYCYEDLSKIENYYEAVNSPEKWECHHKNEIIMNCGVEQLKAVGAYYDRPAHELVFMSSANHRKLHCTGRHYNHTEEAKRKMSESHIGLSTWNKGIKMSDEFRAKVSSRNIGNKYHFGKKHSYSTKKKLSEDMTKRRWWNNGIISVFQEQKPNGDEWKSGRIGWKTL